MRWGFTGGFTQGPLRWGSGCPASCFVMPQFNGARPAIVRTPGWVNECCFPIWREMVPLPEL
jgi:hypothetical protein